MTFRRVVERTARAEDAAAEPAGPPRAQHHHPHQAVPVPHPRLSQVRLLARATQVPGHNSCSSEYRSHETTSSEVDFLVKNGMISGKR